ncbi:D-ribose high-affinity transporter [Escherichia coli]|uniref:D-ribose pyranase n=1 Tax=Escherichia coli TaxID=562 RepID=A0A376TYA5_ECOLX|nr:D-ribose high-affinity transporter [Escherichia coli]
MKKGTVLNSDISSVISRLGHTDTLVVCDAGLPIPKVQRVSIWHNPGCTFFYAGAGRRQNEMQVEAAIIAEEIKQHNPQLHETLLTHLEQLQKHQGNTIEIRYTTHEQFKQQTAESQAVIRSGECFSVCEYHSLCWRDVLRPSWKHYFSLKASIKPSRA